MSLLTDKPSMALDNDTHLPPDIMQFSDLNKRPHIIDVVQTRDHVFFIAARMRVEEKGGWEQGEGGRRESHLRIVLLQESPSVRLHEFDLLSDQLD